MDDQTPSPNPASLSAASSVAPPGPVVVALSSSPPALTLPDDKTVISGRPLGDAPPLVPTPQSIGESLVGKRLEHYELVEFVGGGGMGAVFRATDLRLGRTVAVKVLSRDHTDEETIRRFRNEAQSAARLDHPNIARAYYVGEAHGWNFIVFEFIEGTNLRDVVDANGPLALEDALSYTLQVADALAHSSSRDVVHRDIKPSNVLLMAGGQVKLVDMGLARLHQVEASSDDLTASGVTLGTFDYISPEQARDPRAADVRSDLYSLGCTLYYMLAGQPPFPDGTAMQKLLRHSGDEPPDIRLIRPEISPRVSALLARLLAKRPSQRPQTAEELVGEIVALGQHLGIAGLALRGMTVAPQPVSVMPWTTTVAQILIPVLVLVAAIVLIDAYAPRTPTANVELRPRFAPPPTDISVASQARVGSSKQPSTPTSRSSQPSVPESPNSPGPPAIPTPKTIDSPSESIANSSPAASIGSDPAGSDSAANAVSEEPPQSPLPALTSAPLELGPPATFAEIGLPAQEAVAISIVPPSQSPVGPPVKIRRLVVGPVAPAQIAADTEYQTSLAAACSRAVELGLSDIELQWNGSLVEPAFDIPLSRFTLRAALGYRPTIVFRPAVTGLAGERQMIRLTGGAASRLSLQGIDLRLELPPEPSFGWSLFALSAGQTLELSECVLTVQDGDLDRPPVHDQVAMIVVQPRRTTDTTMSMDPQPSMSSGATITLDRCIARGEATLLNMPEESPVTLRWNQGLLVTPKRLLETSGCMSNPKWFERISLTLDNVTASCRQGLHQMKRRSGSGFQFGLDVTANHCILFTDVDAPLFEFVGVSSVSDSDLNCDGEQNRYPHADVTFLRFRPANPGERPGVISLESSGPWSEESRRLPGVQWRRVPPSDRPAHAQTKDDFLLEPTVLLDAGFDPALLPSIVEPTPLDPPAEG